MTARPAIALVLATMSPGLQPGFGGYHFGMTQAELRAAPECRHWTKLTSSSISTSLTCDEFVAGASRWTLQARFEPETLQALELIQRFRSVEASRSALGDVVSVLDREIGGLTSSALGGEPATAAAIWTSLNARLRPAGGTASIILNGQDRARAAEIGINVTLDSDQATRSFVVTFRFIHHPVPPPVRPEDLTGLVVQHFTLTLWSSADENPAARTYRAETFHETAAALAQRPAVTSDVIVTLRRLQISPADAVDFDGPEVSTWLRVSAGADGERRQGAAFGMPIEPLTIASTPDNSNGATSLSQLIRIAWFADGREHSCMLPARLETDRKLDHFQVVFNAGRVADIANCTSIPNGLVVDVAYRPAK